MKHISVLATLCEHYQSIFLNDDVMHTHSQDFQKGGYMDVCMPVYMHNFINMQDWGLGACSPTKFCHSVMCDTSLSHQEVEMKGPSSHQKAMNI